MNFEESQQPLDKGMVLFGFRKGVLDGERALDGAWLHKVQEPLGWPWPSLRDSVNHHLNAVSFNDRTHCES